MVIQCLNKIQPVQLQFTKSFCRERFFGRAAYATSYALGSGGFNLRCKMWTSTMDLASGISSAGTWEIETSSTDAWELRPVIFIAGVADLGVRASIADAGDFSQMLEDRGRDTARRFFLPRILGNSNISVERNQSICRLTSHWQRRAISLTHHVGRSRYCNSKGFSHIMH